MKNKPEVPETRKVYADGRPSIPSSNPGIGSDKSIATTIIFAIGVVMFAVVIILLIVLVFEKIAA